MKGRYDFSKAKRGRVVPEPTIEKGKVKITTWLDEDAIDRFGAMADALEGAVGYQTLINQALHEYLVLVEECKEDLQDEIATEP